MTQIFLKNNLVIKTAESAKHIHQKMEQHKIMAITTFDQTDAFIRSNEIVAVVDLPNIKKPIEIVH